MKIVDLNILLYAVNSAAAQHERARRWWENAVSDEDSIGLAWVVLLGFLRLSTNPRVFPRPLAPHVAAAKLDADEIEAVVNIDRIGLRMVAESLRRKRAKRR